MANDKTTYKGFVKDLSGKTLLPITRAELVLDSDGQIALHSSKFLAENGLPGLITDVERQMIHTLSGGSGGNLSLTDVYNQINWINTGLQLGGTSVSFFKKNSETGNYTSTPINITAGTGLNFNLDGNTATFSLTELTASTITDKYINNIQIDKYGRVTSISGVDSSTIATINYVEQEIAKVGGVATGALKFAGSVSDADTAESNLIVANANNYYKVTGLFTLSIDEKNVIVHIGDTLIVQKVDSSTVKYIHIPSGDDLQLSITQGESKFIENAIGPLTLDFSDLFSVVKDPNTQKVSINLNESKLNLSQYEVSYSAKTASGYEIGTLTIGGTPHVIYGTNNISSLSLIQNAGSNINPILKFTESGTSDVNITLKGNQGISVVKNNNIVEFGAKLDLAYLEIDKNGYISPVLGAYNEDDGYTNGLVSFETLHNFAVNVTNTCVKFESITGDLSVSEGKVSNEDYYYGSNLLKTAISF